MLHQGTDSRRVKHSAILEHFVDRLHLKDIAMMVPDWDGPIGLGFAGRCPELVRSIVIANTFAWPPDDKFRIHIIYSFIVRSAGDPINRGGVQLFGQFWQTYLLSLLN